MVHELLEEMMQELTAAGRRASLEDLPRMQALATEVLQRWRATIPPPSETAFHRREDGNGEHQRAASNKTGGQETERRHPWPEGFHAPSVSNEPPGATKETELKQRSPTNSRGRLPTKIRTFRN